MRSWSDFFFPPRWKKTDIKVNNLRAYPALWKFQHILPGFDLYQSGRISSEQKQGEQHDTQAQFLFHRRKSYGRNLNIFSL